MTKANDTAAPDQKRQFLHVSIDEIKSHPRHARKPNREQRRKLETSLRKFGENAPILVDRHSFILAGHARYEALKALGRMFVVR